MRLFIVAVQARRESERPFEENQKLKEEILPKVGILKFAKEELT